MKKLFYFVIVLIGLCAYSQTTNPIGIVNNLSPNGYLNNIFDQFGNKYSLSDVKIEAVKYAKTTNAALSTSPTPVVAGYFNLYFESGCGMEGLNATEIARQNVVKRLFQDISDFINSPLTTSQKKVNIWVRNINNVVSSPNGVLGLATSFYSMPYNTTTGFGGIADNEIWKTIHLGEDSYKGVVSPLATSGISSGSSGVFYHGMMAFNFNTTDFPSIPNTPAINWHTTLTSQPAIGLYDLYSVMLHEVTHALGFASLINGDGTSKLGAGFNYYSRYDTFLKNNANTQFLITKPVSTCGTMYNYSFNSSLNTSILHPAYTPNYCSNVLKFVGLSTVPVYTPTTFAAPSSFSHFEGALYPTCTATSSYPFTMNMSLGTALNRRYLKAEERNVLINLGYSVKTTFGMSTNVNLNYFSYGGTVATGINVAGMNDGISTNGLYSYIYTVGSTTALTINSSTNTAIRILANDINATSFECLQDVFDTSAIIPTTSGSATTNVTFSSTVPGLHLLRYVPKNVAGLKGNITYIYVMVESNNTCGTATACDLIKNGNFEQTNTPLNSNGGYDLGRGNNKDSDVCGWSHGNTSTPDYYNSDYPTDYYSYRVPCNIYGFQNDAVANNKGYCGFYIHNSDDTEIIKTSLTTPLQPNTTYQLSFDLSLAEGISANSTKIQAYFSNDTTTYPSGEIPIANPTMLFKSNSYCTKTDGWEKVVFNFTTGSVAGQKCLYLGGLSQTQSNPRIPAPQGVGGCNYISDNNTPNLSYYYIDNVSLIPLNGGSFTLPTPLCDSSPVLPNLNNYLNGIPTSGVYSGSGVVFNAGVYSFDPSAVAPGINTITYTYTNSSGCSVSIYSNIVIEETIYPEIFGSNSAYTTAPNNTTTNTTTIPAGYTALWTITGGSGTITTANNSASVGATWSSLPGQLTLTLTSPAGCTYSVKQYIGNLFHCDCLDTLDFNIIGTTNPISFQVFNTNPLCPLIGGRFFFGDGSSMPPNFNGTSATHSYSIAGTYLVSISRNIKISNAWDGFEYICSRPDISHNVITTGSGVIIADGVGKISHIQDKEDKEILIYPNPNKGIFTVKFNSTSKDAIKIIIHDLRGREVYSESYQNNGLFNETLNLKGFQSGVYLINIEDGNRKEVKKIVIE